MSKRFGRNQRRKLRAELHAAKADARRYHRFFEEEKRRGYRNSQIVEETAHVLGRHFMTLEPDSVEVRSIDQIAHGWRCGFFTESDSVLLYDDAALTAPRFLERVLPVLHCDGLKNSCDRLRQETHIRFTYGGNQVGYAISEDSLQMLRPRDAAERIGREMAAHLMTAFEGR